MKTNMLKKVKCSQCRTALHRDDIQQLPVSSFVEFVAWCPVCGHIETVAKVSREKAEQVAAR